MTKCIDGILFTNYLKEKTEIIIEKTKNIFVQDIFEGHLTLEAQCGIALQVDENDGNELPTSDGQMN